MLIKPLTCITYALCSADPNTQHRHKTARLVDHRSALVLGFFADDAITVPAVVGGGGGAVGVAHGFADASSQAVVAVGGFAGRPQLAGVDQVH